MKKTQYKPIVVLLLVAAMTVCLFGCASDSTDGFAEDIMKRIMVEFGNMDVSEAEYQFDPEAFVLFYEEENADPEYVSRSEIDAYESQFPECISTWYRDQLTEEERTIYNAHLYAMEHCMKGFSLYVADNEKDFDHVRDMLALDSPFLEQNINSSGEFTRTWEGTAQGERIFFYMEQFGKDRWERKLQALEQCREIVENIPAQYQSQEEKMLYLYHVVCDRITYTEYEDLSNQEYLYDAVCLGKTVCDGYSNMLMLLFNLIDVEACEVMGNDVQLPENATKEEIEENEGHTWVTAKLGECYYHFDPTYEDTIGDIQEERRIYFGVSDAMASSKYIDYNSMRPMCLDKSRDFAFVQLDMQSAVEQEEIDALAELTDLRTKDGEYVTYVLVNEIIDEAITDSMLDKYIQKVEHVKRVSVVYVEILGRTLLRVTTEPW